MGWERRRRARTAEPSGGGRCGLTSGSGAARSRQRVGREVEWDLGVVKGSPLGGGCQWIGELGGGCPHGATAELERRSGRRRRTYARARGGATPFIGGVRRADLRWKQRREDKGDPAWPAAVTGAP
jgi:hypothetical protein